MLEVTLPSRRDFKVALDAARLDSTGRNDLNLIYDSAISWQLDPRPRYWLAKFGGFVSLPQGLPKGPLREAMSAYLSIRAHCIEATATKPRIDESWQSWGEILLPSRTNRIY